MPNDNRVPQPNFDLRTPQAGGYISAAEYRKLKDVVSRIVREEFSYEIAAKLRVLSLQDPITPTEANEQTAYSRYWDADNGEWATNESDEKAAVISLGAMSESLPCYFNRQAGAWVPLHLPLIRFELAEDHPGRGVVFGIYKGTWSESTHAYTYNSGTEFKGIDWFNGTTYPAIGATGLFLPKKSDTYGTIYEVVTMDCEAPA